MKDTHLIRMNEEEYAQYLINTMTIDMTMDFHYTKECAIKCCEEMIFISSDTDTIKFIRKVKSIIETK